MTKNTFEVASCKYPRRSTDARHTSELLTQSQTLGPSTLNLDQKALTILLSLVLSPPLLVAVATMGDRSYRRLLITQG